MLAILHISSAMGSVYLMLEWNVASYAILQLTICGCQADGEGTNAGHPREACTMDTRNDLGQQKLHSRS